MERNKIQGVPSICIFDSRFNKINEELGYKNNWDVNINTAFESVFNAYTGSISSKYISADVQFLYYLRKHPDVVPPM